VPGKELYTADALSRAPLTESDQNDTKKVAEIEEYVETTTAILPASSCRLEEYHQAQIKDEICSQVMKFCRNEWPRKRVNGLLSSYWKERGSLIINNNLLMYNDRIVIPQTLQKETLMKIQEGHQGIERCRMRVRASVWWPGVSRAVEDFVKRCSECAKVTPVVREPLMTTPLPDYPWQVVGSDLFENNKEHYLIVVDYFSRYPEVVRLGTTTFSAVITTLKGVFFRYGIPEVLRTDNGPQYESQRFLEFTTDYSITHITSSPRYPQSNAKAEHTVKTVKQLLMQSATSDPYRALLSYWNTPLPWCNLSPAELSMGRQMRTLVPQADNLLISNWPY